MKAATLFVSLSRTVTRCRDPLLVAAAALRLANTPGELTVIAARRRRAAVADRDSGIAIATDKAALVWKHSIAGVLPSLILADPIHPWKPTREDRRRNRLASKVVPHHRVMGLACDVLAGPNRERFFAASPKVD
jgi:hypothetical protein